MDYGWTAFIYETRSGQIELPVELSSSSATRLLTGQGTGSHGIRAQGMSRALLREISEGNRWSLAIGWADDPTFCAYAGVVQGRRLDDETDTATVKTRELPSAMFGDRSFFGVNQYEPVNGKLTITNRSYSGAVRAMLAACMAPSSEWAFPIDLPADGSGSFSKTAKHEEALTLADLLQIVRDMGQEIDFRPYFSGGTVRHQTRVASKINTGVGADLPARAPGSLLVGLSREDDWTDQHTGVGAFGNGQGQVRPYAYAPSSGSGATLTPVRDSFVTFPDIEVPEGDTAAQARLQAAADAEYARTKGSVESTSFGISIWGVGPQIAEPGKLLNLWSYGGLALEDGLTQKRVTGLRVDLSTVITPEVESNAA